MYPQRLMKLTVAKVKAAKPKQRIYRLPGGGGLNLQINPNDSKYWRHRYRLNGKENTRSYGVFPEVSLAEPRQQAMETRNKLRRHEDPKSEAKLPRSG